MYAKTGTFVLFLYFNLSKLTCIASMKLVMLSLRIKISYDKITHYIYDINQIAYPSTLYCNLIASFNHKIYNFKYSQKLKVYMKGMINGFIYKFFICCGRV